MRAENLPGFAPARHARQKLAGFCSRTSCAPKTCRVLLPHAMRTENSPGFAPARHARQKLAGFCSRTPCAPKTCRVLLTHAMRAKNLPGFAPARHARQKLAGFCSAQAMRTRNAPRSSPYLACILVGAYAVAPPRGHSSKRKGAIDGSGGAPDTACRRPSRRRNCGRSGKAFGTSRPAARRQSKTSTTCGRACCDANSQPRT